MNFLIVAGSLDKIESGPYWSVYGLIKGFIEEGHTVTLIGSKATKRLKTENIYGKLDNSEKKFRLIALRNYGLKNFEFIPDIFLHLVRFHHEFDAIIIQGPWISSGWISFLYGKIKGICTIITIRGEFANYDSVRALRKRLFLPWVFYMLRNATMLHFLNNRERRILRFLGIKNASLVIPNGVSNTIIRLKPRPKIVAYIGRLTEGKNLLNLIKAWKIARTSDYFLKIAGTGSSKYVMSLRNEIGTDQSIELVGRIDGEDKTNFLNEADWFVLPSLREGIPMAALEALSNGVIGMFSAECNLNDFFQRNAALLMPLDVDGIAKTLEKALMFREEEKKILLENTNNLLREEYLWSSLVKSFILEIENIKKAKQPL
ncbi:MAG: glycosyltransferase [Chitinophagia bacterium]|nr:glycosyltransferase [Chitinophagia bacterium]